MNAIYHNVGDCTLINNMVKFLVKDSMVDSPINHQISDTNQKESIIINDKLPRDKLSWPPISPILISLARYFNPF